MARLKARAGIARAAATRSGDYWPVNLHITIGGTTRTSNIDRDSLVITQNLNDQTDTATFTAFGFTPTYGQEIIIGLGSLSNRIFAGRIQRVTTKAARRWKDQNARTYYDCYCVDYTWELDKLVVCQSYPSQTVTTIIQQLIGTYASGFSVVHVQGGLGSVEMVFTWETVSRCLTRLAKAVGGYWYVDYDKDVHFWTGTESLGYSPETISLTSGNDWQDLEVTSDYSQTRTRAYVQGQSAVLLAPVAVVEGGGGGVAYTAYVESLDNITDDPDLWLVKGNLLAHTDLLETSSPVLVNGAVSIGSTTIAYDGTGSLPSRGVVLIQGNLVSYTSASAGVISGIPASGEGAVLSAIEDNANIVVPNRISMTPTGTPIQGQPRVDLTLGSQAGDVISLVMKNDASDMTWLSTAESGDGVREHAFVDGRLSPDGADARSQAEVTLYGAGPVVTLRYRSRDANSRVGMTVTVDLATPTLSSTYKLQRVTTTFRHDEAGTNQQPWREVEASSQRMDLYDVLRRIEHPILRANG